MRSCMVEGLNVIVRSILHLLHSTVWRACKVHVYVQCKCPIPEEPYCCLTPACYATFCGAMARVQSDSSIERWLFGVDSIFRTKSDLFLEEAKEIELDGQYGGRTQDLGVISTTL
jgi:hypothetical protein